MTIHVVVPVHNRINLTLQFLESLEEQDTTEDLNVIIVDDGSTDGTSRELANRKTRIPTTVLHGNGNLWWAGAVRMALARIGPQLVSDHWVYLANNDTVLEASHLAYLVETATACAPALVGAVSIEIWPDDTRHRVSSGFRVDTEQLTVEMIQSGGSLETDVDGLAGRGLLMPAAAAKSLRLHPRLMPQHFADISATGALKGQGYQLVVDPRAISTQTDRASSAVEAGATLKPSWNKKDPLYIPAVISFWWFSLSPATFIRKVPAMWKRRSKPIS